MPSIVTIHAIVLLLGIAYSASAQELSRTDPPPEYVTTPAEYTTTPPQYTTTPPEYIPLPDTVPPDFGQEDGQSSDDPYADDSDEEDTTTDPLTSINNVETIVQAYAQYALGMDSTSAQQFVDEFGNIASQLGYQTQDVGLEMGVKIALYLTLTRSLGFSSTLM